MAKYKALVTMLATVEFEAAGDSAAVLYCQTQLDGHPQRVANLARLQHGWMGTDYDTIALVDENDETVMEV